MPTPMTSLGLRALTEQGGSQNGTFSSAPPTLCWWTLSDELRLWLCGGGFLPRNSHQDTSCAEPGFYPPTSWLGLQFAKLTTNRLIQTRFYSSPDKEVNIGHEPLTFLRPLLHSSLQLDWL